MGTWVHAQLYLPFRRIRANREAVHLPLGAMSESTRRRAFLLYRHWASHVEGRLGRIVLHLCCLSCSRVQLCGRRRVLKVLMMRGLWPFCSHMLFQKSKHSCA